jgi:5-(carboxyamino)imidazole ribonucleotide synthase
MNRASRALPPGAVIGILGGGQLGRMLVLAAARLGYQCHVYSPERDGCALQVVGRQTVAPYSDRTALRRFAGDCDVITYEFENVPSDTARTLASYTPVLPDPSVLETTQDRLNEKDFVRSLGIKTVPFAAVSADTELEGACAVTGLPAVLKTRRFGYDGKGQKIVKTARDLTRAWRSMNGAPCILEGFAGFEREISVIAARGRDGRVICFDVTENIHRTHILRQSMVPARISPALAARARKIARTIADGLNYVGVLAVEMFVTCGARGPLLLVNEIAPRVHNSGHWTLDGANVSQFEQHIRAITGLPLVEPVTAGPARMVNLIGADVRAAGAWATQRHASLHLYGKKGIRPGRKMGHVNIVQRAHAASR